MGILKARPWIGWKRRIRLWCVPWPPEKECNAEYGNYWNDDEQEFFCLAAYMHVFHLFSVLWWSYSHYWVECLQQAKLSPTSLHAFASPPYSCNAMGLFLLTEVFRNSSALPGGGSAEGGGNMCEGQERGISGVICHSCACRNPILPLCAGMTSQVVLQGMRRSPVATTTVIPAMSTRSPASRTFRMPPREDAW